MRSCTVRLKLHIIPGVQSQCAQYSTVIMDATVIVFEVPAELVQAKLQGLDFDVSRRDETITGAATVLRSIESLKIFAFPQSLYSVFLTRLRRPMSQSFNYSLNLHSL